MQVVHQSVENIHFEQVSPLRSPPIFFSGASPLLKSFPVGAPSTLQAILVDVITSPVPHVKRTVIESGSDTISFLSFVPGCASLQNCKLFAHYRVLRRSAVHFKRERTFDFDVNNIEAPASPAPNGNAQRAPLFCLHHRKRDVAYSGGRRLKDHSVTNPFSVRFMAASATGAILAHRWPF